MIRSQREVPINGDQISLLDDVLLREVPFINKNFIDYQADHYSSHKFSEPSKQNLILFTFNVPLIYHILQHSSI